MPRGVVGLALLPFQCIFSGAAHHWEVFAAVGVAVLVEAEVQGLGFAEAAVVAAAAGSLLEHGVCQHGFVTNERRSVWGSVFFWWHGKENRAAASHV